MFTECDHMKPDNPYINVLASKIAHSGTLYTFLPPGVKLALDHILFHFFVSSLHEWCIIVRNVARMWGLA